MSQGNTTMDDPVGHEKGHPVDERHTILRLKRQHSKKVSHGALERACAQGDL